MQGIYRTRKGYEVREVKVEGRKVVENAGKGEKLVAASNDKNALDRAFEALKGAK